MAHRRIVLVAWIALAVGLFGASAGVGRKNSNDFTLPGTGSQQALNVLNHGFKAQAGDTDQIVFNARTGTLGGDRAVIDRTLARVAGLPHVTGVISPFAPAQHAVSRDGTIGFATVNFNERADVLPVSSINRVIAVAESARSPQLQVELGGQAIEQASGPSLGFATFVGVAAAIVILLIAFGSVSAMVLPIVTAVVGLVAGLGASGLLSHSIKMPDFAAQLALMIGLGVGVDYALFVVTRFRQNYRSNAGDVESAVANALDTAGRAVLFAGATVVVALLGMFALGVKLLSGAGVASALAVALVLAASVTLLPALLKMTGHRVGAPGRLAGRESANTGQFWHRWVARVQRRPAATALAATALMLAFAAPALGLRLASSDAGNDPTSQTTRQAYDLLAKGFGPGFSGPIQLAVALPHPGDTAAVSKITTALRDARGVASVAPAQLNPARTTAAILAYPTTSPQSQQTASLVHRLRGKVLPPAEQTTHAHVYVGGPTASQVDFSHVLSSRLPVFIAVVIGVAMLLLLVVFRSLAIPLQGAVMNLLSVGASFGITQALLERGWLGVQKGPIEPWIPVMAFAIIFGLSMDYEVFLVSRIHEEWQTRHDPEAAIREGTARTGRVITAAAAVMVAVFVAFALSGTRILEEFGIALAAGVFLDALVIRMLLLPAVLQMLGRTAWKLPPLLERRLPHIAIEPDERRGPPQALKPALEEGS
jgi:RND superfamily putative drug exporter